MNKLKMQKLIVLIFILFPCHIMACADDPFEGAEVTATMDAGGIICVKIKLKGIEKIKKKCVKPDEKEYKEAIEELPDLRPGKTITKKYDKSTFI